MRNVTTRQDEFSLVANVISSQSSLILTGLGFFNDYEYKYRAINIFGAGGNSSIATLGTGIAPPMPKFPLVISLDTNITTTLAVRFDWNAHNSSESGIPVTSY